MAFYHRLRPPDEFHKNRTFSVLKSAGGETRHSLKMQDVSLLRLPRALLCSRLMVYWCLPQLWLRFLIPRLTLNST